MKRPIIFLFTFLFLFSCKKYEVESTVAESQFLGVFRQIGPPIPTGFPAINTYENVIMNIETSKNNFQVFTILDGNVEIFSAKLQFKNNSDFEVKYEPKGSSYKGDGKYDANTGQISFNITSTDSYTMTFVGKRK